MSDEQHSVGITKGAPVYTGGYADDPRGPKKYAAQWHGTCSCGWTGESDTTADVAQSDALSHAAGFTVRPRIVKRTSYHEPGSKKTVRAGYGLF